MQTTNLKTEQPPITRSQRSQLQRETIGALQRLSARIASTVAALEAVKVPANRQLTLCLIGELDKHLSRALVVVPILAEKEPSSP